MLRCDRQNDRRIFRTLGLVDGDRIGQHEAVEFAALIGDLAAVEIDRDLSRLGIDLGDEAEIAVIDLLVVVVLDLHHLVFGRKRRSEFLDFSRLED